MAKRSKALEDFLGTCHLWVAMVEGALPAGLALREELFPRFTNPGLSTAGGTSQVDRGVARATKALEVVPILAIGDVDLRAVAVAAGGGGHW